MLSKKINGYTIYENGVIVGLHGKELKHFINKDGYEKVRIRINNKPNTRFVHRLLALAFIPKIDGKVEINHKDGNKRNNDLNNLEWCTRQENVDHALENDLIKSSMPVRIKKGNNFIIEAKSRKQLSRVLGHSKEYIEMKIRQKSFILPHGFKIDINYLDK